MFESVYIFLSPIKYSICGDEVTESKPSAQPLHMLCDQANVSPEECIVVGDTSSDTGMGKNSNAGLVVGVLSGSGTKGQLLSTGAHIVVPNVDYLPKLLVGENFMHDDDEPSLPALAVRNDALDLKKIRV